MSSLKQGFGLVSVGECKRILGLDDREDGFTGYLVVTASYSIEAYCMRSLVYRKHTDYIDFGNSYALAVGEYPVRSVLSVKSKEKMITGDEYYGVGYARDEGFDIWPEIGAIKNTPYFIHLARKCRIVRVEYMAGYKTSEVPPDLQNACIELVAWNYARHTNRKIGVECETERNMPENVTNLLERWKRKTI
jgi:uncharacterized phiE125 gp8 family phage protein